ncbi:hypothetical protein FISHEDRAFT_62199 [Fistulina hepatica ATCC 64428]|nr:hypothetical protein FISHEDRAFT_62199 [Fistulina hepatica ATCC 64428]
MKWNIQASSKFAADSSSATSQGGSDSSSGYPPDNILPPPASAANHPEDGRLSSPPAGFVGFVANLTPTHFGEDSVPSSPMQLSTFLPNSSSGASISTLKNGERHPLAPPLHPDEIDMFGHPDGKGRRRSKNGDDPNRVKRPCNAWMLFRNRVSNKRLLPECKDGVTQASLNCSIRDKWAYLKVYERPIYEEWIQFAAMVKAEHNRRYPNYKYAPKHPSTKKGANKSEDSDDDEEDELESIPGPSSVENRSSNRRPARRASLSAPPQSAPRLISGPPTSATRSTTNDGSLPKIIPRPAVRHSVPALRTTNMSNSRTKESQSPAPLPSIAQRSSLPDIKLPPLRSLSSLPQLHEPSHPLRHRGSGISEASTSSLPSLTLRSSLESIDRPNLPSFAELTADVDFKDGTEDREFHPPISYARASSENFTNPFHNNEPYVRLNGDYFPASEVPSSGSKFASASRAITRHNRITASARRVITPDPPESMRVDRSERDRERLCVYPDIASDDESSDNMDTTRLRPYRYMYDPSGPPSQSPSPSPSPSLYLNRHSTANSLSADDNTAARLRTSASEDFPIRSTWVARSANLPTVGGSRRGANGGPSQRLAMLRPSSLGSRSVSEVSSPPLSDDEMNVDE